MRCSRWLSQSPDAEHAGQHREGELAAGGLRSVREESADPTERGVLFLLWHDQHPRSRRDCRDEGVGGAALPVRELGLLRRGELSDLAKVWKVRVCRLGASVAERVARANGRAPADSLESGNPVDPVVDDVPQPSQDATGCEDPSSRTVGSARCSSVSIAGSGSSAQYTAACA